MFENTQNLEDTHIFDLKIGNRTYTVDTQWLLNLKTGLTDSLGDLELEDSLQRVAGYLHTFSSAYECANREKIKVELEYEIWYEQLFKIMEETLIKEYQQEINAGLRSKTNSTPTRSNVHTKLICSREIEYREQTTKLNEAKANADYLFRELKLIESRGTHLQTLIKSRQAVRSIES